MIASVSTYYSTLPISPQVSCIDLLLQLEIMETLIKHSGEDCRESIEAFISQAIAHIPTLAWQQTHILLNFVTACMTYGKLGRPFALRIFATLEELASHQTWQIREKCASALRVLRNNQDQEVRAKAHSLHQAMKQEEAQRIDGHQGILNVLRLMPLRIDEEYQQKECIHNFDNSRRVVGRETEVAELEEIFKTHRLVALVGEGGIGKSSVAQKYAQEMQFSCKIVWQINSEGKISLLEGLTYLAEKLGVEIENNKDIINNLMAKLSGFRDSMLIVFDNCINQAHISEYCIENPRIKYLATSRSKEWDALLQVQKFSPDASLAFLQGLIRNFHEKEEMKLLVEKLAHWPLAIQQSACIINSKKLTVKQFSSTIEADLNKRDTIQRLFYQVLVKLENNTVSILKLLCMCDSQAIPEIMIKEIFLQKYDENDWWVARSALVNRYVISVEGEFWNLHRILHVYIRDRYQLTETQSFVEYYAEEFIVHSDIWIDQKSVQKIRNLKPHVTELLTHIQEYSIQEVYILDNVAMYFFRIDVNFEEAIKVLDKFTLAVTSGAFEKIDLADLYYRLGCLYSDKADYVKSEEFFMKALEIRKEILQPNHPNIATVYINLGNLYKLKMDYVKSEEFYLKCLKVREEIVESDHPYLANLYMNLGNLYSETKDYAKSEGFFIKCMNIQEEILPPGHPKLANVYMNLANLYSDKADYDRSEEFYRRCLKIREEILPPSHPLIADLYMNMGSLYGDKAEYDRSEEFYIKCLKIREKNLPPSHPHMADLYMNMAGLYMNKNEYDTSEEFYKKCLKIREEILPLNHTRIADICLNLGNLYKSKLDYEKSEEFYMKSLKIREEILPQNHPDLATLYMNLGLLHSDKTDYDRSECFYLKCLKIREEILQPAHPDLAGLYMNLGNLYSERTEYDQSEYFYIKCMTIHEEILPPNYLQIADSYANLAILYSEKKEYSKSEDFYRRCMKIREDTLPSNHPQIADIYMNLALLYKNTREYEKSEEFSMKCLEIREKILPGHSSLADVYMQLAILCSEKTDYDGSELFI